MSEALTPKFWLLGTRSPFSSRVRSLDSYIPLIYRNPRAYYQRYLATVSSRFPDGQPLPESTATAQQSSRTKLANPKLRERRQAQSAR